jgi:hypothetical protein
MSFLDKINDRIGSLYTTATAKIPPILAMEEIREQRLAICKSCDFYFEPTGQCKKCGCFVKTKTAVARAKCPMYKWVEVIKK